MKTEHDIKSAIARSQSHDEVVAVTIEAKDMPEAYAEICAAYDGEVDYTETNEENVYDVWGWTDEQGTDETDFRLLVTIAPSSYDTYQDGNFVETIQAANPDEAFAYAKDHIATGEWTTPGNVRVSVSDEGSADYVRDGYVERVVEA